MQTEPNPRKTASVAPRRFFGTFETEEQARAWKLLSKQQKQQAGLLAIGDNAQVEQQLAQTANKLARAQVDIIQAQLDTLQAQTDSDTHTDTIVPAIAELNLVIRSGKKDYGLSGDLELEYSRQDPTTAMEHAATLTKIANTHGVIRVIIIGEGATRLVRSPFPIVSAALKRLCLKKAVLIDGKEYRGLKGALQIEMAGLTRTVQTRAKAMLKGFLVPRPDTVAKHGREQCGKMALSRLPETLRLWALENAWYDCKDLIVAFMTSFGRPTVPMSEEDIQLALDKAERSINEQLEQYRVEPITLLNRDIMVQFLSNMEHDGVEATCKKRNCDTTVHKTGLCATHYTQHQQWLNE